MTIDPEDWLTCASYLRTTDGNMQHEYDMLYINAIGEADSDMHMTEKDRVWFRRLILARLWKVIFRKHATRDDNTTWGDE